MKLPTAKKARELLEERDAIEHLRQSSVEMIEKDGDIPKMYKPRMIQSEECHLDDMIRKIEDKIEAL